MQCNLQNVVCDKIPITDIRESNANLLFFRCFDFDGCKNSHFCLPSIFFTLSEMKTVNGNKIRTRYLYLFIVIITRGSISHNRLIYSHCPSFSLSLSLSLNFLPTVPSKHERFNESLRNILHAAEKCKKREYIYSK